MINLLPKPQQQQVRYGLLSHQVMNFWLWVAGSLVVLVVLVFLASVRIKQELVQTETAIAANREQLASDTNRQLENEVLTLNSDLKKINTLQTQAYHWSQALLELGQLIPLDFVVDILSLDRKTGRVAISGTAGDRANILLFWSAIHKSRHFRDINFPLANLERVRQAPFTFEFNLNAEEIKRTQP